MVQLHTSMVKETSESRKTKPENAHLATVGSARQAWRVIQINGTWERGPDGNQDNLKTTEIDKTTFRL